MIFPSPYWLLTCALVAALPPSRTENSLVRRQSRPNSYEPYTIDQPIDHFPDNPRYAPHTDATFKQRYFFDDTYYKAGGPVFLYISGETSGESRFDNLQTGIVQILMEYFNGLGVILENRYYGESYPFNTSSTTDELVYLSNEQTIADNAYFAQRAVFPGVDGDLTAPGTPWITYGGSLAGAESAFTVKTYGGSGEKLIYGGIGSSGVINAILAYPYWYDPIQKFAPQDCVASINGIIENFDMLVNANNMGAVQQFKELFGLGALSDLRDFAMTIAFPIGGPMNYPTSTWQELNWNTTYGSRDWFYFCSNVTNLQPPANNTAADNLFANYTENVPWTGLGNYAAYVKKFIVPLCTNGNIDSTDEGCFSTQNQTFYADTTSSSSRSYLYSTCTELGAYQVAQPNDKPTLLSRVVQTDYTQQWCTWAFPPGEYNSIPTDGPNLTHYNQYGGFNLTAERLALIDGAQDVWLDVCYHSHLAPDRYPPVPVGKEGDIDEYLITGAGHHWDSYGILDVEAEPQFIREAHLWEIRTLERWLSKFTSDWHMK